MLQMPVASEKIVQTDQDASDAADDSDCHCPGYYKDQCEAQASQGCIWTDAGDSNAPWCQCDPNFVPPATVPPTIAPLNNGVVPSFTPAPPPPVEVPTCPEGWVQVGDAGADIPGCGLQACEDRYTDQSASAEQCAWNCNDMEGCEGFTYGPRYADQNHEWTPVCTLYDSNTPTPGETWSGSAGYIQIFCARLTGQSQCSQAVMEKCGDRSPCIDLREDLSHHHIMYLNDDGTAHIDGSLSASVDAGTDAGSGSWTCTRDGHGSGLVGTWNCGDLYIGADGVQQPITITQNYDDDFTPTVSNDMIEVCTLPIPTDSAYGEPCNAATGNINGVPVCTVAANDGNPNPWILFGDINHQINNFVAADWSSSPTTSGQSNGDSLQVGTFSAGTIGSPAYSLDIGQFCTGGTCTTDFDLMIQFGSSDVFSHSEYGYSTTGGGFINNGHTAEGVVIGEHGLFGSNTDRPNGYYATYCAYNGGCRGNGNDFWSFSTHGVYPNAASSVVCGMYYGGSSAPWKDCPSGDNGHRMRYYIRSDDLTVTYS